MNVWFTSDTHFGHANVIKHDKRPFTTIEEMDAAIIENWNSQVKQNDIVWHLGDFNFRSIKSPRWYFEQLNGNINLITGNHDDSKDAAESIKHRFGSYQDYKYLRLFNEKINLFHYKMQVWRASNHGSWHLFGHSHGNLKPTGKAMDVGIMTNNYKLYHFDEIKAYMDKQPLTFHHSEVN